jgi:hypothetical protein
MLSWIANMSWAGGGAVAPAVGAGVLASKDLLGQRKRYTYGYRYIWRPTWLISLVLR